MKSYLVVLVLGILGSAPIKVDGQAILSAIKSNESAITSNANEFDSTVVPPLENVRKPSHDKKLIGISQIPIDEENVFDGMLLLEKMMIEEKSKLFIQTGHDEKLSLPFVQQDATQNASRCYTDVLAVFEAAKKKKRWALNMIDAGAKPGPGLLRGNLRFLGDYDQCLDVDVQGENFKSRYCTTYLGVQAIDNFKFSTPQVLFIGFCVPNSCDKTDFEYLMNTYFLSRPGSIAGAANTYCQLRHPVLSPQAKLAIVVLSLLTTLIVVGTVYDVLIQYWKEYNSAKSEQFPTVAKDAVWPSTSTAVTEQKPIVELGSHKLYSGSVIDLPKREDIQKSEIYNICHQLLISFSLYTNVPRILSTQNPPGSISCIHGLRFFSICWVMLFHSVAGTIPLGTAINIRAFLAKSYSRWTFTVFPNALVSVDTFFILSGFLVSLTTLKQLKDKPVTLRFFGSFYFNRFWRLTPPYMLMLMTYVTLFKYISDGPQWFQDGYDKDDCKGTWWTNLLYISNLIKVKDECMNWTWYLSNDMQFFIVSPLLFLPMLYYQWKGLLVPLVVILISAFCAGVTSSANHLPPFRIFEYLVPDSKYNFYNVYYVKPYIRIGPYIVGIMLGYLFNKADGKVKIPRVWVCLGWLSCLGTMFAIEYGPYKAMEQALNNQAVALFNAVHRTLWGVCIAWIIFACHFGYGGLINRFLSWKAFVPFSKMTYCAYLLHSPVILFILYSKRTNTYMDTNTVALNFVLVVTLSFAVAFVAALAFELPMVGLGKIIKGRGASKNTGKQ